MISLESQRGDGEMLIDRGRKTYIVESLASELFLLVVFLEWNTFLILSILTAFAQDSELKVCVHLVISTGSAMG